VDGRDATDVVTDRAPTAHRVDPGGGDQLVVSAEPVVGAPLRSLTLVSLDGSLPPVEQVVAHLGEGRREVVLPVQVMEAGNAVSVALGDRQVVRIDLVRTGTAGRPGDGARGVGPPAVRPGAVSRWRPPARAGALATTPPAPR
jgi:hypothetical protein